MDFTDFAGASIASPSPHRRSEPHTELDRNAVGQHNKDGLRELLRRIEKRFEATQVQMGANAATSQRQTVETAVGFVETPVSSDVIVGLLSKEPAASSRSYPSKTAVMSSETVLVREVPSSGAKEDCGSMEAQRVPSEASSFCPSAVNLESANLFAYSEERVRKIVQDSLAKARVEWESFLQEEMQRSMDQAHHMCMVVCEEFSKAMNHAHEDETLPFRVAGLERGLADLVASCSVQRRDQERTEEKTHGDIREVQCAIEMLTEEVAKSGPRDREVHARIGKLEDDMATNLASFRGQMLEIKAIVTQLHKQLDGPHEAGQQASWKEERQKEHIQASAQEKENQSVPQCLVSGSGHIQTLTSPRPAGHLSPALTAVGEPVTQRISSAALAVGLEPVTQRVNSAAPGVGIPSLMQLPPFMPQSPPQVRRFTMVRSTSSSDMHQGAPSADAVDAGGSGSMADNARGVLHPRSPASRSMPYAFAGVIASAQRDSSPVHRSLSPRQSPEAQHLYGPRVPQGMGAPDALGCAAPPRNLSLCAPAARHGSASSPRNLSLCAPATKPRQSVGPSTQRGVRSSVGASTASCGGRGLHGSRGERPSPGPKVTL